MSLARTTRPERLDAKYLAVLAERREAVVSSLGIILNPLQPIVLEIGSGHGHYLTAYAQAYPDRLCVGIDLLEDRVVRALKKRDRARLTNLHFLHAEAGLFLECLPASAELESIFVLFPDPWPKLRHHKHRLIQESRLAALAARASRSARLYFRTDHEDYFAAARQEFTRSPTWELVEEPWPFEHPTVFQTRASAFCSLVARPRA